MGENSVESFPSSCSYLSSSSSFPALYLFLFFSPSFYVHRIDECALHLILKSTGHPVRLLDWMPVPHLQWEARPLESD